MSSPSNNSSRPSESIFEQLEERVLFDGVPDATMIPPEAESPAPPPAHVQSADAAEAQVSRELVIVDPQFGDADAVLAALMQSRPDAHLEIHTLDGNQDGIGQISDLLSSSDNAHSALHILASGEDGQIQLGRTSLTEDNVSRYVGQLAEWSTSLREGAEINIHGAELDSYIAGEALLESISAVTGAAVSDETTSDNVQIIFVDGGVEDADALIAEAKAGFEEGVSYEIYDISSDRDGLIQIGDVLQGRTGIDAIHILSHGNEGEVVLGNTSLTNGNLDQRAAELSDWASALSTDADLLFYGCELAGSESGESLIESISQLTGADVAASDDVTGAAEQGGDWDLEYSTGAIHTGVLSAYSYTQILALADATLNIVSSGTPTWDPNNDPGNDTDGDNNIIRSHDSLLMEVFYNTDSGGATDLNFTSTLPEGLVWEFLPAAAALDSRSMIVDSVTGLEGGDMRTIIAYLPDVSGTFTSSVTFEARALGGQQGTALDGVTFEVNSAENSAALGTDSFDFVLSSAANMDIRLLSPTFRGVFDNAAGTEQGVVYSYGIGIFGAHPTRTGSDGVKGAAPIEDNFTFDLDFSDVADGATVFSWGPSLGTSTETATDGINRNYERFVNLAGVTATAWSQSNRPAGQTDEFPSATWDQEHSTPDSGDWTITGSTATTSSVQVSGADTSGSHFPELTGGSSVIPASDKWFTASTVHVWIPVDEILLGEDGADGTTDDGVLRITPRITNFDPDDQWGVTNNFGDSAIENTDNNDYTHTVFATSIGGSTKYNSEASHPTSGRWLDTSSFWNAGDAETSIGHTYDGRVSSGQNSGVLPLDGVIFGDKFDNTATKIAANSYPAQSDDGWSRVYVSGGPNTGSFLRYGVDYIIEFGTGGVDGDPGGWTDWDSMGDATLADDQSPVWTEDPTDVALGGNAYADGVRDSITKWRIKLLRDLEPGENMISLVTMETVGHSSIDLANNPGGNIIANFNARTAGYLQRSASATDDWQTSEYDPLTNTWYTGGTSSHLARGDRLWIVDANVDVDKTIIDLGAGNNYLAGSSATVQLEATVTIPGPDSGAPAQDVYITDMLPEGLTVVGGSAQPAAGTTFTAGDGSTVSVKAVEYYSPDTAEWSTTWTYGATGIRWFYGDVPLNTALPTMTFDVLIPFDARNGESWTNTAVASSPSDDSTEEFRSSSAGLVAVQIAAMAAGKQVVTPLVPEDTTIIYDIGIANVSDDKDVPWFDLIDVLPYDGDFEGSSFSGNYTYIDVENLGADLEVYVTSTSASILDSQDGTVDGYADPGTPSDTWYDLEGTGNWQFTLDDVQNGVAGAPTMEQITAIRVVSDKTIDPYLGPGESTSFLLELTPTGNNGIPSDRYTNKFAARTDPGALPLPVTSAAVTAVVVAPDIVIEKEVALDESHLNIDPTNDAHWGETVNFDDTDKAYFRLKVTNTGTADFLGATVTDSLPAGATFVAGTATASTGDVSGFPSTWTLDLAAGDSAYVIYQLDVNDAGNYVNTADVEATDAWGQTVTATDDAEANFVTEVSAAKQQIGAVRSTADPSVFEVTYEVEILNSSIFDMASLTLTESLSGAFGAGYQGIHTDPAIVSSSLSPSGVLPTVNGAFDGDGDDQVLNGDGLLLSGDSVTLRYTVLVDPLLLADPANTVNQVQAGGLTGGPGGTPTTDLSDDGSDPATDNPGTRGDNGAGGTDDPTPLALPAIDLTKKIIGSPTPAISGTTGNFDVTYEFTIENTGTVDLDTISVSEDFIANLGGAFVGIVNAPRVTATTATDNPDLNQPYDGGATDSDVFLGTPTTHTFDLGGSSSQSYVGKQTVIGSDSFIIDPNQEYTLEVDASAGPGSGGVFDTDSRHYLGFASYDIDGNFVSLYNYSKYAGSTDTTLAVDLNPGDTTVTLTDATGWHDGGTSHARSLVWYGYQDSTGYTYPDYTYTRNQLLNGWDAGDISGNTITLRTPWAGPALAAGDAVRNTNSGSSYQYVLLSNSHVGTTPQNFSAQIGGGFIENGVGGTTLWRPGTHSIRPLALADFRNDDVQLNLSDFQITAPNMSLLEPEQTVTFQITVEIDPDAGTAVYDGTTSDGNDTLENQASVTAQDAWNGLAVADTSDDPTDATNAEYGDDSDPDDPTSLAIASIELTKELSGVPVVASSGTFGNFDATYQFTITNNGNDDLQGLSLVEDFQTQFGAAFVGIVSQGGAPAVVVSESATDDVEINLNYDGSTVTEIFDNTGGQTNLLELGQTITIQVVVEVDPDAVGANYTDGQLLNIANTAGTGVISGGTVDDESDDEADSTNIDADGDNSPDDPTPLDIPSISLTKAAGDAVANGDNWDVTFTKVVKNTGTVALNNLQLFDDIAAQFGNAYVSVGSPTVQNFTGTGTAPTANAAWAGDNALSMLSGGQIDRGDSFEVVFTVTIDPDGIDSISNALENTSTVSGDAIDADGDPLLDDSGSQITATDDSDNGVNPDSENGEDNMDGTAGNDPTPIVIADISAAKQVVGTPTALSNGNFEATYQVVVENTGTVDLANLTLAEDLNAQFGAAYVDAYGLTLVTPPADASSSLTLDTANWDGESVTEIVNTAIPSLLAIGDSFIFQFSVEIDAEQASGVLNNTVTATGNAVDENGVPLTNSSGTPITTTDDSDSGTDPSSTNPGEDGDNGTSDDSTPLYIADIGLAKDASDAVANGDNFDVTFTLVWENTGTVALDNVTILDDVSAQFGSQFVSVTGLAVQNFSGTGTVPTANTAWQADRTLSLINSAGALEVDDTFEVVFTVTIDPDAAGSSTPGLENQATSSGEALDENGDPILDGAGAPVTANDESDDGVDPTQENGSEDTTDGIFANDPTPVIIADLSVTKQVVGAPVAVGDNFQVTYQAVIENTGTVNLADLSLADDLDAQFGQAFVSASGLTLLTAPANADSLVVLDTANWDGDANPEMMSQSTATSLAVGDFFVVQFTVVVDPDATGTSSALNNTVIVGGDAVDSDGNPLTDSSGNPISTTDASDSGTNPSTTNPGEPGDTGGSDDATPLLIADLGVGKQANTVTEATDGSGGVLNGVFDIQYLVVIENTGTVELTNLQLIDDLTLTTQFGDAYDPTLLAGTADRSGLVIGPAIVSHTMANSGDLPTLNAGFLGGGAQAGLFDGSSGALQVGEQIVVSFTVRVDTFEIGDGDPTDGVAANQVTGEADSAVGSTTDLSDNGLNPNTDNGDGTTSDPTPLEVPQIRIWKAHGDSTPNGDGTSTVPVTLRVVNSGTVTLTNLSLSEDIASQFGAAFVSATVPTIDASGAPGSTVPAGLINSSWNGDTSLDMFDSAVTSEMLLAGEEFTISFDIVVDPDLLDDDADYLQNLASVSGDGLNFDGVTVITVTDDSAFDNGSGVDSDEAIPAIVPEIGVVKSAGTAVANGDNWDVTFTLVVENTGSVNLDTLTLFDDIDTQFGDAFVSVTDLAVQNFLGAGTAPTANAAWTADTTENILTGGALNPGDRFEVVYTVTIDPDGVDSISSTLNNQATTSGRGVDQLGNPLTNGSGSELTATDVSDSGTSPQGTNPGENGDTGTDSDPTPVIIADVDVAKSIVGSPVLLANGNFEVVYQLVVENTGTTDLADVSLTDDLATEFGGAFAGLSNLTLSTPPGNADSRISINTSGWDGTAGTDIVDTTASNLFKVGDSFTVQFTVEIDAAAATGNLDNQAQTGGTAVDSSGNPYTDSATNNPITATDQSDSGTNPSTDNPGEPGDAGTGASDDPTPLYLPNIGLAKSATDPVANATDSSNFDVTFTLNWENTGTVALDNVTILDDIASQFGDQFVGVTLDGVAHSGTGAAPAANAGWAADTTQSIVTSTGVLDIGDTVQVTFTVTIDPDAGGTSSEGLLNQATTTGEAIDENGNPILDSSGAPVTVTDDSDNGIDPTSENGEDNGDGTFANDPTPIVIADISTVKQVVGTPTLLSNGNYQATYQVVVENTGNVDLANLSLVEDLGTQFGSAYVDAEGLTLVGGPSNANSSITLDSANWNGGAATQMMSLASATLLAAGDSFTIQFVVEVDPDAVAAPGQLDNQVTVGGAAVDSSGTAITDSTGTAITTSDTSDSGTNPNDNNSGAPGDTGTTDDPTPLLIPAVGLAKQAGDAVANGDNWDVAFTFVYENTGTVALTTPSLVDDIRSEFGNAFVSATGLAIQNFAGTGTAPGINAAWMGDTSLDLLDGTGQLDVGDSFEVVFTVTLDPDGIDSVAQSLINQGTATGVGINPDTGTADPNLTVTDVSDNGTDVSGENAEDNNDGTFGNDPTPIVIADVSTAKAVVGTPTLLANGNFQANYQVVIENTGTVDLAGLSLDEDLATQFGAAFVGASDLTIATPPSNSASSIVLNTANWNGGSLTEMVQTAVPSLLAVGDSFIIEFTVEIDAAQATGVLENTVTVTGNAVDADGNPLTDSSGTAITATDDSDSGSDPSTTNSGNPGDTGGTDDATPLYVPNIGLAKAVGDAVANGDFFDVTFTLNWENTGTVALDNVQILDNIASQFGAQFQNVTLDSLTAGAGNVGSAPTLNTAWESDTTQSLITSTGPLEVGDTLEIVFTVTIDPDASGTSSAGLTNQATSSGEGLDENGTPLTNADGSPVTVFDDSDAGIDPTSENGEDEDSDGIFGNDPTVIVISDIAAAKQVSGTPVQLDNGNFSLTFEVVVENTGNVDLSDLSLLEDLSGQFGTALISAGDLTLVRGPSNTASNISVDSDWNGNADVEMISQSVNTRLAVGDSFAVQFTAEVDPDAVGAPGALVNQVTASGTAVDENGDPIVDSTGTPFTPTDTSDTGDNPNTNNTGEPGDTGSTDDPTQIYIPALGVAKSAGDAIANGDNWDVTFTFVVENTGTVDLNNLTLTDDIATEFDNAFVEVVSSSLSINSAAANPPAVNSAWEGDTSLDLLDGTGSLAVGESYEISFTVTIDPDGIDSLSQGLTNQGTASGDALDENGDPLTDGNGNPLQATDVSDAGTDPNGDNSGDENNDGVVGNDPTAVVIADLGVAKQTAGAATQLDNGNFEVVYQLVVENTGTVDLANLSLVDDLQTQFGAAFVDVSNLTLLTAPADSDSGVTLDTNGWDGTAATNIIDQTIPSSLAIGDSFTVGFTVEIDAAQATGDLANTATADGVAVDEDGSPITDSTGTQVTASDDSDSGTDPSATNPNGDGDTGGSDDPTPLYIPDVGLAKQAGDAVPNGENFDVTFTLAWQNTGTVALTNLEIFDDLATEFGSQFVGVSGLAVQNFSGSSADAPSINAGWLTDTSQSLVTGGTAAIGDSFEVVFTVTIDPDVTGTSASGLTNQATTNGEALDENGVPLVDGNGDPVIASDDSDNGVDPVTDNEGDENEDGIVGNDSTPVVIADIAVAKSTVGIPTELPSGNFSVNYQLVVENTGNVDLAGVSIVEDIASQFGSAFINGGDLTLATAPGNSASSITLDASGWDGSATTEMIDSTAASLLAVGDSFVIEFTVEVDPDAVGAPADLDNQVTAAGDAVDEDGNPITDSTGTAIVVTDDSDSGTDANGGNPDDQGDNGAGATDDPTPLLIPDIGIAKTAGAAVANGDDWDVTFTLVVENIGTVRLDDLSVTDDIAAQFGNAYVSASNLTVANFNGTGTLPTANAAWEGDTSLNMLNGGSLEVGDSFEIVFTVTIDPDGVDNVSQSLENQATAAAAGINPDGTPMLGSDGSPVVTSDDSDDGTDPQGENGEATSDDGIAANDPTQVNIADLGSVKNVTGIPELLPNGNFNVTYQIVVENTGTVDLADLSLTDSVATQFGSAFVSAGDLTLVTAPTDANSDIVVDSNWDGTTGEMIDQTAATSLAVGDSFMVQFNVELDPDAPAAPATIANQATVSGTAIDENGAPITGPGSTPMTANDDTDSGVDPNGNNPGAPGDTEGTDDPTVLQIPAIGLAKQSGDAVANGDNFDVTFTLVYQNTGTVDLQNLTLIDDVAAGFGATFVDVRGLTVQNFSGTGTIPAANTAWEGDTSVNLLSGGVANVGDSFEVVFTVTIDPDATGTAAQLTNSAVAGGDAIDANGDPILDQNGDPVQASDTSDDGVNPNDENGSEETPDGVFANDPSPILIADLRAAKDLVESPQLLDNENFFVTYQIVVENTGTVDLNNVSLTEDLQTQFGSALVDVSGLILSTAPTNAASNISVNNAGWDGSSLTEVLNSSGQTLAVGDSFTVQFNVEVDPDAAGAPDDLANQVTVAGDGVDENGDPVTDSNGDTLVATDASDSGTDPNGANDGNDGNTGGTDDPTRLYLPSVGVAKQADFAVPNGENLDVTFTLVWENTGSTILSNLTLVDDIATQFGAQFVDVTNAAVQNFSGSGTAPTINGLWESDTSQNILVGGTANQGDSFEVSFTVTLAPNASGSFGALTNQAVGSGEGIDDNGNPLLDDNGNPFGATDASDDGIDPQGENSSDNSDGIPNNDPTPILYADLGIAKSVVEVSDVTFNGHAIVTFQLVVENMGTADLDSLSLLEDLVTQFGSAYVDAGDLVITSGPSDPSSSISLNSAGWNGDTDQEMMDPSVNSRLAAGDQFTAEFTVEVDSLEITDGLTNQVTGSGNALDENGNQILDANGVPIQAVDVSDNGVNTQTENGEDDADGIFGNDPTPVDIPIDPAGFFYDADTGEILGGGFISVTGPNPDSVNLIDAGQDGSYQFFGDDDGLYTVRVTAPPGYALDLSALQAAGFDPTGLGSPVSLGATDSNGDGVLDDLDVTEYYLQFDLEAGDPIVINNNLPFRRVTPSGAAGNPPNLPGIAPLNSTPVSSLLSGYTGSPGPIYSGQDVVGGYSGSGGAGSPLADGGVADGGIPGNGLADGGVPDAGVPNNRTTDQQGSGRNMLTTNGNRNINLGNYCGCGPRPAPVSDNLAWSIDRDANTLPETANRNQFEITLKGDVRARQSASVELNLVDKNTEGITGVDDRLIEQVLSAVDNYDGPGQLTFDGERLTYTSDQSGSEMSPLLIDLPIADQGAETGLEDVSIILEDPKDSTILRDGEVVPEEFTPPGLEDSETGEAETNGKTSRLDGAEGQTSGKVSFLQRFKNWLA